SPPYSGNTRTTGSVLGQARDVAVLPACRPLAGFAGAGRASPGGRPPGPPGAGCARGQGPAVLVGGATPRAPRCALRAGAGPRRASRGGDPPGSPVRAARGGRGARGRAPPC